MAKTLQNNCNISEWLTFEFLIELLILTLSWLQTVDCAYPSDSCPLCCRLIYLPAQTDLSLLPTSSQPPSHSSMPSLSLHICVYERARIIAHPRSSLMGLISINITVERTFVLPQPAFLTNPFSWQWVLGGGYIIFWQGFFFFRVEERQMSWALFDWCTAVGIWKLQTSYFVKVQKYDCKMEGKTLVKMRRPEWKSQAEKIMIWRRTGRHMKVENVRVGSKTLA